MTKETVLKAIQRLENLHHDDEFAYEEAVMAFLSIGKVPVVVDSFDSSTSICRARTHNSNTDFYTKISDISIPPSIFVKNYARCNKPFQSKFYGSEDRTTSYEELAESWLVEYEPGTKFHVTISQWITQKEFRLVLVASPETELRKSNFDKYYGASLDQFLSNYDSETKESFRVFYQFFFEKFRKDAKKDTKTYIITSAYSNIALSLCANKADGIIYPSVPFKGQGMNFAINSSSFNRENFKLKKVYRNEMIVSSKVSETAIVESSSLDFENDKILW